MFYFYNTNDNICYYTQEQYNETSKADHTLTIIHFSCRSLYVNFNNIRNTKAS